MYFTYLLRLSNLQYYAGFSANLDNRVKAHQNGQVSATRNLRPVKLVFYCAFITKQKALAFEKYLKSSSGFAFRNKRLV